MIIFWVIALIGGVAVGLQGVTNTALRAQSSLASTLFLNAVIVLALVLLLATFDPGFWANLQKIQKSSAKLWLGGFYGAVILLCAIFAVPKLGVANALICFIWGQLLTALVVDHYGLFGLTPSPISVKRVLGLLLVIAGAFLCRK